MVEVPQESAFLRRRLRSLPFRFWKQFVDGLFHALDFLGPEHVLLGSDAPFISPADHLATLSRLQLSEEHYASLAGGNARRMLSLDV